MIIFNKLARYQFKKRIQAVLSKPVTVMIEKIALNTEIHVVGNEL